MPLFKHILDGNLEAKDGLKYYTPSFNKNVAWESVEPLIRTAEEQFVVPMIGSELHDELLTAYSAYPLTPMTTAQEAIIRRLQKAIASFTAFLFVQEMLMQLSDMGPTESTGDKAIMPRQWVTRNSMSYHWKQAHIFLDKALQYLELNANAYSTWKTSDSFSEQTGSFINRAADLGGYLPTDVNSIVFLKLKPHIKEAERRYIRPVLGPNFFDELLAAIADKATTALTDAQSQVLHYIRYALSRWALHAAIPYLQMEIGEGGMVAPGFDDGIEKKNKPSLQQINSLWVSSEQAARIFTLDLRNFLDVNAADYPTWSDWAGAGKTPAEGIMDSEGYIWPPDSDDDDYSAATVGFF